MLFKKYNGNDKIDLRKRMKKKKTMKGKYMNISQEKREKMLMLLSKIKEEKKEDKDVVIALNEIENEIKNIKYGLMWEEHEEEVDKELEHSIPIFSEEKDKEILVDEKGKFNFLLEGDNLHSLKLLQRTHKEKIDIIYIDHHTILRTRISYMMII